MSALLLVILGLIGLVVGGELLVRGAVSAAKSFGISPMVIGLTLVGFGTSTPELVTSLIRQSATATRYRRHDIFATMCPHVQGNQRTRQRTHHPEPQPLGAARMA